MEEYDSEGGKISSDVYNFKLFVKCWYIRHDFDRKLLRRDYVYATANDQIDTLYQCLYNWINHIKDFSLSDKIDTLIYLTKDKHNSFNLYDSYMITSYDSYVVIRTNFGMRDQKGYYGEAVFKMSKKNIVKFRKRLLEYTKNNNINIIE